jgi:hypothetical protein
MLEALELELDDVDRTELLVVVVIPDEVERAELAEEMELPDEPARVEVATVDPFDPELLELGPEDAGFDCVDCEPVPELPGREPEPAVVATEALLPEGDPEPTSELDSVVEPGLPLSEESPDDDEHAASAIKAAVDSRRERTLMAVTLLLQGRTPTTSRGEGNKGAPRGHALTFLRPSHGTRARGAFLDTHLWPKSARLRHLGDKRAHGTLVRTRPQRTSWFQLREPWRSAPSFAGARFLRP